ncbi:MAG: 4-(cytidine 5'-diphospho)-2-C-methyl-D-erythritol kinase [Thermomicrobiales bacterium]
MNAVIVRAPAKLNLGLEILGRRDDGYHEIRTVMQTVSIFDQITLAPAPADRLSCSIPALATDQNLAIQAVVLMRDHFGPTPGIHIDLVKAIPTAAGLGGASSDAAAVLRGSCTLGSFTCSDPKLQELALQIGSDVPFFLKGGTMLAEGRGERLTALPPLTEVWFVVASPRISVPNKTRGMYGLLQPRDFSDGSSVTALTESIVNRKPIPWDRMVNRFERAATELFPEIVEMRHTFKRAGAPFVAMTGAGPSHFTASADPDQAKAIHAGLTRAIGQWAELFLCRPIPAVSPVELV